MRDLAYPRIRPRFQPIFSRFGSAQIQPLLDALLVIAFMVDLLTPFFVWKGMLPATVSWISHVLAVVLIAYAYTRMMHMHYIPGAVWAIVGFLAVGVTVALTRGQGVVATLWGAWLFVKYPLVGLYAYLRSHWGKRFPQRLTNFCLFLVAFEVIFQIAQYLTGQVIGDNLAGTFGWHGVAHLLFLIIFLLCLTLGQWLAHGTWKPLLATLVLGVISGVLAENKFFPVVVVLLASLAIGLYILRGRRIWRALLFAVLLLGGILAFTTGYNALVPRADRRPLESILLDEDTRSAYLTKVHRSRTSALQTYNLGRNVAVLYALDTISGDPVALLFGFGVGSRRESRSLGTVGTVLGEDAFHQGSDLVILIQETGLFGLILMGAIVLWLVVVLVKGIRREPHSEATAIRYGLLLFSVLWPLWLWYSSAWSTRVTMWLYWVALGYALGESRRTAQGTES
jgi:hypothetical protein